MTDKPIPTEPQETADLDAGLEKLQGQNDAIVERLENLRRIDIKVVDLNVSFWDLTWLLLKVALAAVPAALVLGLLAWLLVLLGAAVVGY